MAACLLQSIILPEWLRRIEKPGIRKNCLALENGRDFQSGSRALVRWPSTAACRCKRVNISEWVTDIESGAFQDCVSLKEVKIPESVEEIGDGAFQGCSFSGDH